MINPDILKTQGQFFAARHLKEILLMKHGQESSGGSRIIYGDEQVAEAFEKLAERLGYRVLRAVPEISPRGEIRPIAAE